MEPQLQNQLAELAHKLGTSVEKLWPILVDKARFDAVCEMVVGCVLLGVLLPLSVKAYRVIKSELREERYKRCEDKIFFTSLALASAIAFMSLSGFCIMRSISNMIYPEAAVIQNMLNK